MKPKFTPNRLAGETSPYLLQHSHNPVDWYPWGDDALGKAAQEEKPIFLSIGYSACHWCHVMERETFMDERVAAFLNDHFVTIKVDREERPDLDSIYMNSVVLLTGQGGWPTSVFLTPDLEPFYGGTYFPPVPRHGLPSFMDVLHAVHQAWTQDRQGIRESAAEISRRVKQNSLLHIPPGSPPTENPLETAREELLAAYDWQNGGWGRAPKFPQPMLLEFLLLQASRGHSQCLAAVLHNLDVMQHGGILDLVGGGFHRYSTDAQWLVPHFEKMLYDNAQLARVYLHAYLLTGEQDYRRTCESTLDFIERELRDPSGGFTSSLDADSEGEEGAYYLWTIGELASLLSIDQLDLLKKTCLLSDKGNFDGKIILQLHAGRSEIARALTLPLEDLNARLDEIFSVLFAARETRPRPQTDDKVLTGWNALTLQALAEAGRFLGRSDYLEAAQSNAEFILAELRKPEGLYRSWRSGEVKQPAYLEDYAALVIALLSLYQSDFNQTWFSAAESLFIEMQQNFSDPGGGYFDTPSGAGRLLYRPKEVQDNAVPSGNALAVYASLLFNAFSIQSDALADAERQIERMQTFITRYPGAFGFWLQALDFQHGPVRQIALITPQADKAHNPLGEFLLKTYLPRTVIAAGKYPPEEGSPQLILERPVIEGSPTAYVCEDYSCRLPVTRLEDLLAQLA